MTGAKINIHLKTLRRTTNERNLISIKQDSRRSPSQKVETDLHMIDTLDDSASQVIVKNCFDPLRPRQQTIRKDILADMVPLMNLT